MDIPEAEENLAAFRKQMEEDGKSAQIFPISAVTKEGIQPLLYRVADMLDAIPDAPLLEEVQEVEERKVYRMEKKNEYDNDFVIRRENDVFVVESPSIEKLMKRTNFTTEEGVLRFARILRNMGIDKALRERGAVDGQTIRLNDYEFEFVEKS